MVESKGREDQQRVAYKLKGTSIDSKQGLGKKATSCRQQRIEEGLHEVLQAVGRDIKGPIGVKKEGQ